MAVIEAFPNIWISVLLLVSFDLTSLFQNNRLSTFPSSFLAFAFNIDEEFPIVISNSFNGNESHFGASVALLSFNRSGGVISQSPEITGWVLIGAPKANASTNVNNSKVFEPGVIWRCSLGTTVDKWQIPGGSENEINKLCEIVEIDPTGEYDPFDPRQPFKDRKDGGWLGGTMLTGNSNRFVTCASRWVNQKFNAIYLLNGICYWLPDSELTKESNGVGSYWPKLESDMSYRLSPLLNKSRQIYKNQDEKRDDWAFGQFGFSIHLTSDNELIAGAPGTLDWTGSVVYYRDNSSPNKLLQRFNAKEGNPVFSEVLVVSAQTMGEYLQPSDYFGYSVTSGKFFAPNVTGNRTQFAAGAPRSSQLSGKVIVFTLTSVEGARSEGKLEVLGEPLEGHETGKGNHYCSYFGHSLLALDVNGDGFDDLLVSAPLYGTSIRYKRNAFSSDADDNEGMGTETNSTEGKSPKMKSGDEGCVFVYLSTGVQAEFVLPPQDLCGDKVAGARFGLALSSLRDINNDGLNDIAVGAPYENDGHGAVYIYQGGEEHMELAQKLEPSRISSQIRTFGWSVALGEDIDNNSYPDLAVGAYETNQVVIYRTIPVINFKSTLTASIPKLLNTTDEFNLTTCITYSGRGVVPTLLPIWVKLTIEVDEKRQVALKEHFDKDALLLNGSSIPSRSRRGSNGQPLYLLSYKKQLYFPSSGKQACYNFSAVKIKDVDDGLVTNVTIRQDYWVDGHDREIGETKPIFYDIFPQQILSPTGFALPGVNSSQSKSRFGDFGSTKVPLPAGNMFGTDRLNLSGHTICEDDEDPQCRANLTISGWLKDYSSGKIYNSSRPFTLGTNDTLALEVELTNHKEVARLPVNIILNWLGPPTVRSQPSNCVKLSISSLSCSIPNAIRAHQKELMTLFLDMSGVNASPPEERNQLRVSVEATTNSALAQPVLHEIVVDFATRMRPHNYSHIGSKIEYSSGNESIPTFGFTQAFEVALEGPSTAPSVQVTFDIPTGFVLPGKKGGEDFYQLIGVKRPILTYDGEMNCDAVEGSFLDDEDRQRGLTPTRIRRSSSKLENFVEESVQDRHNYTATQVLEGTLRQVKKSLLMGSRPSDSIENIDFSGILKLHCNSSFNSVLKITCLRIVCTATHFSPSKKAVVELKLRMFKSVAATLLAPANYDKVMDPDADFDGITSLWVESSGVVRTLSKNGRPFGESASLRYISRLELPPPSEIPAWILLMSVASGLLIFSLVTIFLKKCGFFQRSKRDLLIKRKVEELERSRLLATDNDSPSASTSSTARIRSMSSRRHNETGNQRHSRYNTGGASNGEIGSNSINFPFPSSDGAGGSILGVSVSSPGTAVKQREIPGAMDLKELRRLYDFAYIDDTPDQTEYF